MFKFIAPLAIFTAFMAQASAQGLGRIPVGGVCGTIAGPVSSRCVTGSVCCNVAPDLNLCTLGSECPREFIPEGGLCSGIAGPVPLPCYPGTTCCNVSPDNYQCLRDCKA
ncbi:hypothetical protein CVT24_000793 [Panaeolus cyanescens]|uniref:Hydrophobin n=1 Tax=Panaeolus cyanescens TaxID=181874 RepID=A0A409YCN6_9AGAR|nr:hypothetical protein CVT24_000793 [Panaeolus cyanescens]